MLKHMHACIEPKELRRAAVQGSISKAHTQPREHAQERHTPTRACILGIIPIHISTIHIPCQEGTLILCIPKQCKHPRHMPVYDHVGIMHAPQVSAEMTMSGQQVQQHDVQNLLGIVTVVYLG